MFTWVFRELNFKYIFKLWVYKQTREPPADAAVYSEVLTPPIFLWWWRQAGWREGSSKATWRAPGDLRRKRHQRTQASSQTWRSADTISQGKQTYKYYNHKSWNQDSWLVISSLIPPVPAPILNFPLYFPIPHHFFVFQYFWSFFSTFTETCTALYSGSIK